MSIYRNNWVTLALFERVPKNLNLNEPKTLKKKKKCTAVVVIAGLARLVYII